MTAAVNSTLRYTPVCSGTCENIQHGSVLGVSCAEKPVVGPSDGSSVGGSSLCEGRLHVSFSPPELRQETVTCYSLYIIIKVSLCSTFFV